MKNFIFALKEPIMVSKKVHITEGDITRLKVDAIVNAANTTLMGGGGVDGAIHRAAGPALLEECAVLGGCQTGEAKITKGYNLPAKYVIHTVGPVWSGGGHHEAELLASCYKNSLRVAQENKVKTIAFPAISTGAYRFPVETASRIALTETKKFLESKTDIQNVIFICFDHKIRDIYLRQYKEIFF